MELYALDGLSLVDVSVLLKIYLVPSNSYNDIIAHYLAKLLHPFLHFHKRFSIRDIIYQQSTI
jgi:hypothetical protein